MAKGTTDCSELKQATPSSPSDAILIPRDPTIVAEPSFGDGKGERVVYIETLPL